jgi:hypothetical protein
MRVLFSISSLNRQAVTDGLSPYLNAKIKELAGDNEKVNIAAHALWGSIEAQASGNNALAGATAAASGEMVAKLLTQQIYGKEPQDLTASEKETISSLSQVVGALSAVAVANNSNDAYRGAELAKSAVENNLYHYVNQNPDVANRMFVISNADSISQEVEKKFAEEFADRAIPHYVVVEGVVYKYPVKVAINTRTADIFTGGGINPITLPTTGLSASAQVGWIVNLDRNDIGENLEKTINNTLSGNSVGGTLCYGITCGSVSNTILTEKPRVLIGIGLGGGASFGGDGMYKIGGQYEK